MMIWNVRTTTTATLLFATLTCLAVLPSRVLADAFDTKIVNPPAAELVAALQKGGHIIYFRHAHTPNMTDKDISNLDNCLLQRNLDEEGRAQMRAVGDAFKRLKIPVGEVLASPYCRTMETARLAFGRVEKSAYLYSTGEPEQDEQKARTKLLSERLSTPPPPGKNIILVSHGSPLDSAAGEFLREGEAAIARPSGDGKVKVIARVQAEAWAGFSDSR